MDTNFMESVWWVFKQIWNKDLVYYGWKVQPYSTGCQTPLSNFEANGEDTYKKIHDLTAYVKFKLVDSDNTYVLAWTTTPWTLPSNLALCVNEKIKYVKVLDHKSKQYYILAEDCLPNVYIPIKPKKENKEEKKKKKRKEKGLRASKTGDF